ncbi:hypothetical protein [Actinoplanes philippinensis]|uniref:hypothetical protein n=1 Tax=Actinoplanes philippinensis TaxID=35752 RepID=UPI0033DE7F2F
MSDTDKPTMIPQATPLFGYLWVNDEQTADIPPRQVMVIGWQLEDYGVGYPAYCPVMIEINSPVSGDASTYPDGWVWHLTTQAPSANEGMRIRAQYNVGRRRVEPL